jgi:hypothetical protein
VPAEGILKASHLCPPHILENLPCKYWASTVYAILPGLQVSYAIPVRQASALPLASFRHPLTGLPLPLASASPYQVHKGLSPSSISALPDAHKKALRSKGLLNLSDSCLMTYYKLPDVSFAIVNQVNIICSILEMACINSD